MWAADKLRAFVEDINRFRELRTEHAHESADAAADELVCVDPVMRELMNSAHPGFGDYITLDDAQAVHYSTDYWDLNVKPWALRAIGVHQLGAEARERTRPDIPDLAADQFHPWVWEAAMPMWQAGSTQEAVHAAARSVNARLQQKLGRHNTSDAALCRDAFSTGNPAAGHPRLRFAGDRTSNTWRSRQQGGMEFGAGCFEGIRNLAAHVDGLNLPEHIALEQLAAFSVLARWIGECTVEAVA
jgi:hypothetical protein